VATLRNAQITEAEIVRRGNASDFRFAVLGVAILLFVLAAMVALVSDFVIDGVPRIDAQFMTSFPSRKPMDAGILAAWVGTTLVMFVTAFLAIPIGVAAGLYLEEYAGKNWFNDIIEINVSNLAGVPSIIYGLLALGLLVQTFGFGRIIFVAGATLALLILPIIIVATREAIRSIPLEIREAAYAMGADKWQVVSNYVLPSAQPGILTGAIVGMSRAIGETAPLITIGALTFIAFLPPAPIQDTPPFVNMDWLNSAYTVMPMQMFNWISRPQAGFHVNAAATGVILVGMTLLMNSFAVYLRYRIRRRQR
jgi:phosphate transport system permease protein